AAGHPRGALFTVSLPIASVPAESLPARDAEPAPCGRNGAPLRLLVVDDEPGIGRYLSACLKNLGHSVQVLTDPREAEALLLEKEPLDGVFSDVCMPVLGGPELYRRVVQQVPHYRGRFVFVTGAAFGDLDIGLEQGNRLLLKPFSPEQVRAALVAPRIAAQ
ncbi:MAG: response regulator, partial [Planctomycetota bacterium]